MSGRSENTPITSTADLRQASIYLSRPHLDSRDATLDTLPLHQGYPHLQQFAPSNGIGPQGLSSLHPNSSPSSTPLPSHQPEDHDISTADLPTAASTTPYDRKRSLQDESAPPSDKKSKYDTTQPSDQKRFTATSFQHMTREQLVDRLVLLENERVDLLQQQQQQTAGKKDKRLDEKASSSPVLISDDDIQGKKTDSSKTDEDDDEDDDDEESESISSVTDTTANDTTSNDTTEMRCLWKNCGETCVGVQGLTGHIVRTHVGGGKVNHQKSNGSLLMILPSLFTTVNGKIVGGSKSLLRSDTRSAIIFASIPGNDRLCVKSRVRKVGRSWTMEDSPCFFSIGCEKRFSRPDSLVT